MSRSAGPREQKWDREILGRSRSRRTLRTPASSLQPPASLDAALQQAISWLLAGALLASVIFMGMRYQFEWLAWGEPVLVGILSLATILWFIRLVVKPSLGLVFSWSYLIAVAAGLLGLLQLIELPADSIWICSPGLEGIQVLGRSQPATAASWESWTRISLTPWRTIACLRFFGLYCLTFVLVVNNVRTLWQVRRLLSCLFVIGSAVAIFGILQYMTWNGKFFWLFEIPWVPDKNILRGPFTNRNHFSGYLAMTIGPALFWLVTMIGALDRKRSRSSSKRDFLVPIGFLVLAAMMVASFLSLSRGGIIATTAAFLLASVGLSILCHWKREWLFLAVFVCLAFGGLMIFVGTQNVEARLATIDLESISDGSVSIARANHWKGLLGAVIDFPLLGSGLGSHQYVYHLYCQEMASRTFTHAHNDYLELLVEGGVPLAVLLLLGLMFLARCSLVASFRSHSEVAAAAVAVAASLLAAAIHGAVDFVWHIPSHALLIAVLAGLSLTLLRLSRPSSSQNPVLTPSRWIIGAGGACAAIGCSIWLFSTLTYVSAAGLPEFASLRLEEEENESEGDDPEILREALGHQPNDPILHFRLAEAFYQSFLKSSAWQETPMPVIQIREAISGSSAEECESWFITVFGETNLRLLKDAGHHYERAVQQCPLIGRAFLRLAELRFLGQRDDPTAQRLVAQAVRTSPYDPAILYEAGLDLLASGRTKDGLGYWKRAADESRVYQIAILMNLIETVSIKDILTYFHPDFRSILWLIRERLGEPEASDSRLALLTYAKDRVLQEEDDDFIGLRLYRLGELFTREGDWEQALGCASRAVTEQPYVAHYRLLYARCLMNLSRLQEAEIQLKRCHFSNPNDPRIRALQSELFDRIQRQRFSPLISSESDDSETKRK